MGTMILSFTYQIYCHLRESTLSVGYTFTILSRQAGWFSLTNETHINYTQGMLITNIESCCFRCCRFYLYFVWSWDIFFSSTVLSVLLWSELLVIVSKFSELVKVWFCNVGDWICLGEIFFCFAHSSWPFRDMISWFANKLGTISHEILSLSNSKMKIPVPLSI